MRKHGHLGGARIGIVAKPSAEFVASIIGTWLSGGVAVPLALSYPEAELLHVMNDSVRPCVPFPFLLFLIISLSLDNVIYWLYLLIFIISD